MKLIGTIHYDIQGPERLEHILNKEMPEKISVEFYKIKNIKEAQSLVLKNREKRKKEIKKWNLPKPLKNFAYRISESYGFELTTTIRYIKKTGASLYLVDNPKMKKYYESDSFLRSLIKELMNSLVKRWSKNNKNNILRNNLNLTPKTELDNLVKNREICYIQFFDGFYYKKNPRILKIFEELPEKVYQEIKSDIFKTKNKEKRENFMAKEIIKNMPEIHIGGFSHIFDDSVLSVGILYKRLEKYVTERIRLCDAMKR